MTVWSLVVIGLSGCVQAPSEKAVQLIPPSPAEYPDLSGVETIAVVDVGVEGEPNRGRVRFVEPLRVPELTAAEREVLEDEDGGYTVDFLEFYEPTPPPGHITYVSPEPSQVEIGRIGEGGVSTTRMPVWATVRAHGQARIPGTIGTDRTFRAYIYLPKPPAAYVGRPSSIRVGVNRPAHVATQVPR